MTIATWVELHDELMNLLQNNRLSIEFEPLDNRACNFYVSGEKHRARVEENCNIRFIDGFSFQELTGVSDPECQKAIIELVRNNSKHEKIVYYQKLLKDMIKDLSNWGSTITIKIWLGDIDEYLEPAILYSPQGNDFTIELNVK